MSFSAFSIVEKVNIDEQHLKLTEMFINDQNSKKICLFSNVHYDDYNKIYIFPVVERCLKMIIADDTYRTAVQSSGIEAYCQLACEFVLGNNSKAIAQNRCFGIPTISSIGALRLGAQFLREKLSYTTYCTVFPDFRGIYKGVFTSAGFEKGFALRMPEKENFSFKYFLLDLARVPNRSVLVIGMCGITSTGADPSMLEWYIIAQIVARKGLFVFFDATFQGLVSGDVDLDAYPVRYLEQQGFEFFVAQDFSFNMDLIGERPGNLCVVLKSATACKNTKLILREIMRLSYFSPSVLGTCIVSKILGDLDLRAEYYRNLKGIVIKLDNMRKWFLCTLRGVCRKNYWDKYEGQRGLYLNLELNTNQIEHLRNEHHIYLPNGGWFCLAGLNTLNLSLFCRKIVEVIDCEKLNTEEKTLKWIPTLKAKSGNIRS